MRLLIVQEDIYHLLTGETVASALTPRERTASSEYPAPQTFGKAQV